MGMKVNSFSDLNFGSTGARSAFQWGGTIFALFLLLMNRIGQRSHMLTNLLVLFLLASFPTVLFKIRPIWLLGCVSCCCFAPVFSRYLSSFAFHPFCHYARLVGR
ncbi:cold-regulated 413 plasma membrane protein 4 isoform X2 [Gossypium hirsutum]|uniref:Cold-regulated 413 plasma membrane protein 4 isoform X2 n=1 Tax=Gossypium hirsutum TaxID=3635 RepID=A0A1U8K3F2_GOSHI|nr:cold-regulated 413 plasma membrane protein 4 isoform X2 [Gossypium hirsutum]